MKYLDSYGSNSPDKILAKQGMTAIGGIVGGLGLFLMSALPSVAGIALGVVVLIAGISGLISRDPSDKKPGLIVTVAGALAVFSRVGFIRPLAATILGISAIGLLAVGIVNGIKFLYGLKRKRED
ncbi:MAG: hypothetical protein LBQ88_14820 [Treponema sp.]|jgi:hypothetical protein|nr:hypothetical protein [Treponema sp.]